MDRQAARVAANESEDERVQSLNVVRPLQRFLKHKYLEMSRLTLDMTKERAQLFFIILGVLLFRRLARQ
jgi:hypothetical protein